MPRRFVMALAGTIFLLLLIGIVQVGGNLGVRDGNAQNLAIPPTPHPLTGREQCLTCHGPGGVRAVPADHQGRAENTCVACHQAAPAEAVKTASDAAPKPAAPTGDAACIACHQGSVSVTLASGEALQAKIDPAELAGSVHGKNVSCTACHTDKAGGYPHPKVTAADRRSYTATAAQGCTGCHKDAAEQFGASVHGTSLASGNVKAATCVDCHGAHNVGSPARLERRPQLCASCHSVVTESYLPSVHGQLLTSGRADAASCLSCHVKNISAHSLAAVADQEGPTASRNVPDTCGKCHQQALKTYESTFHGRAMRLGVNNNAPNCVDCHGAYGVQRVHAAEAPLDETKVATACAKCHQGANASFASGWMGHEEASPSWFPAVFFTERFLFFLTTSVVAFGILHVELDLLRWLVGRRKGKGKEEK